MKGLDNVMSLTSNDDANISIMLFVYRSWENDFPNGKCSKLILFIKKLFSERRKEKKNIWKLKLVETLKLSN